MIYRILILRRAQKELAELSKRDYERMKSAILALSSNPRPNQCTKLVSREGWRMRVGNYRVIYDISDSDMTVTILHIGHRKDVYR